MKSKIADYITLAEIQHLFEISGPDVVWRVSRNSNIHSGKIAGALKKDKHTYYRYVGIKCSDGQTRRVLAHVIAFVLHNGKWPAGMVDHQDGNGLNNTFKNLREADFYQNGFNAGISKASTTGVKGVGLLQDGRAKPYRAQLRSHRKHVLNMCFSTLEEAKVAVQEARIKHHGAFARHD